MKLVERDAFFDTAKGIGIISVVLGHCCPPVMRFVYTYHLILFFFITGFFYNKKKYEKDPVGNIVNKLKNNYPKYVFYSLLFLLLHNLILKFGIINSSNYSVFDFIKNGINTTIFVPSEVLVAALWFVPVMIYAISIFGILVYIGSKFGNEIKSIIFLGFSSSILGIIGLIINERAINIQLHAEISILIMPVIFLAYLCKILHEHKIDFRKYLTWYGFLISVVLMVLILKHYPNCSIDLLGHNIFTKKLFFLVVIIGLYMSLSFTKIISKFKYFSLHIAWIGKYSFEIMALHFLQFKIIDYIYIKLGNESFLALNNFPISEPKLWYIYLIFGIYGSLLLHFVLLNFKKMCTWIFAFVKLKTLGA